MTADTYLIVASIAAAAAAASGALAKPYAFAGCTMLALVAGWSAWLMSQPLPL